MDPSSIPPIANNFNQWPNWNFTSYYDVTIYIFFMSLYIPSLIVIQKSPLFQHACYKLMFSIGIFDLMGDFLYSFIPEILSIMGANYCDHNMLIIAVGHMAHGNLGSSTHKMAEERFVAVSVY
ncbi:serpentine type 7TM GPCR chemoreceptor srt domain-containing protein [Ditylenchus destructor]|nr:serpentine type 7TM GPCR chemoreceptor srt domain-containing protein [Ditylenchus destructor]